MKRRESVMRPNSQGTGLRQCSCVSKEWSDNVISILFFNHRPVLFEKDANMQSHTFQVGPADSLPHRRLIWSALRPSRSPLISVHFLSPMRCTASTINASSSVLHSLTTLWKSTIAYLFTTFILRKNYLCFFGLRLRTSSGNSGRPRLRLLSIGKTYLAPNTSTNEGNGSSSSSQRTASATSEVAVIFGVICQPVLTPTKLSSLSDTIFLASYCVLACHVVVVAGLFFLLLPNFECFFCSVLLHDLQFACWLDDG